VAIAGVSSPLFGKDQAFMSAWPEGVRIHMVGIGGSGMSSLALLLKERGALVSGSDRSCTPLIEGLRNRGITVFAPCSDFDGFPEDTDLLVYTAAVDESDPRISAARRQGIEVVKYAQMLGRIMEHYTGIAVAGSHGKTSVTALAAYLLKAARMGPSFILGGFAPDLGGGGGSGRGDFFIAEACEYDRSFLNLKPRYAIVTNLEEDHLDYYGSFENLCRAFETFIADLAGQSGHLIIGEDAARVLTPRRFSGLDVWTFGLGDDADLAISDMTQSGEKAIFRMTLHGRDLGAFQSNLPGRHNLLNAGAACLLAIKVGAPVSAIKEALPHFKGVHRRLEERGIFGGIRVFSDYAHHPTEVNAVLDSLRGHYPGSRLVAAYQGHQDWRTGFFLNEFGKVLAGFDLTMILKTFSVREKNTEGLPGGEILADTINRCGGRSLYVGDLSSATSAMMPHLKKGDLLVLMGAGNIDEISGIVEKQLSVH
jgi:UDP-N-acetylmuramate--alanine ligase